MKPLDKNKAIIASAGSGKTTYIVEQALSLKDKKILITTYTNENIDQVHQYFIQMIGYVPTNISIISWYSFLLQDCIRPYQATLTQRDRINSIIFENLPLSIQRVSKTNVDHYFLTEKNNIYRDRASDFACLADSNSNGLVVKRLEKVYDYVFIDEIQDLAGHDLDLLRKFFGSSLNVVVVGDPRQATFSTNNSSKNKKYKRSQIFDWLFELKNNDLISIEEKTDCHRCNQAICDLADSLYPSFPKTISKNLEVTGHDGIFKIKEEEVESYVREHNPVILRYNKKNTTLNLPAVNIGMSKGRTYDRVLVFPTNPMIELLATKDVSKCKDLPKLYIAITRARYSVAFVVND